MTKYIETEFLMKDIIYTVSVLILYLLVAILGDVWYSNWYNNALGIEIIFIFPGVLLLIAIILLVNYKFDSISHSVKSKTRSLGSLLLVFLIGSQCLLDYIRNRVETICTLNYGNYENIEINFRKDQTVKIYNEHMLGTDFVFGDYSVKDSAILLSEPIEVNQYVLGDSIYLENDKIHITITYMKPNKIYADSINLKWNKCFREMVSGIGKYDEIEY